MRNWPIVMVVEDDPKMLGLITRVLSSRGYLVVAASDALDAKFLLDENISLVITDFSMPYISGADFSRIVKRCYPKMPVMVISGLKDALTQIDQECADVFLYKKFRNEDLVKIVESLVASNLFLITLLR